MSAGSVLCPNWTWCDQVSTGQANTNLFISTTGQAKKQIFPSAPKGPSRLPIREQAPALDPAQHAECTHQHTKQQAADHDAGHLALAEALAGLCRSRLRPRHTAHSTHTRQEDLSVMIAQWRRHACPAVSVWCSLHGLLVSTLVRRCGMACRVVGNDRFHSSRPPFILTRTAFPYWYSKLLRARPGSVGAPASAGRGAVVWHVTALSATSTPITPS